MSEKSHLYPINFSPTVQTFSPLNYPSSPNVFYSQKVQVSSPTFYDNKPSSESLEQSKTKLKMLERENRLKEEENHALSEMNQDLKSHVETLEEKLKEMLFMPENSDSDRDLTTRLMEQQEFFQKKQKLYEEERARLLQILQNREQLCQEIQNSKSNESEYVIQELEAKLMEKEDQMENLIVKVKCLNSSNEELKSQLTSKDQNFALQKQEIESKTKRLLGENEKICMLNNTLLSELENLRNIYTNADCNNTMFLEEITLKHQKEMEAQKNQLVQLYEMEKNSLATRLSDLQFHFEHFKNTHEEVLIENESLRKENNELQTFLSIENRKKEDLLSFVTRTKELELKLETILGKNEELVILYEASRQEGEDFRRKYEALNVSQADFLGEMQRKFEEEKDILIKEEVIRHTSILKEENIDLSDNLRLYILKTEEMNERMNMMARENEKLNTLLSEKLKEFETMKIDVLNYKNLQERQDDYLVVYEKVRTENRRLREDIEKVLSDNEKVNNLIVAKETEISSIKEQYKILYEDYEIRIRDFTITNTQQIELINDLKHDIETINDKKGESDHNSLLASRLLEENSRVRKGIEHDLIDLKNLQIETENANGALRKKISLLEDLNKEINFRFEEKTKEVNVLLSKLESVENNFSIQSQEYSSNLEKSLEVYQIEIQRLQTTLQKTQENYQKLELEFQTTSAQLKESQSLLLEIREKCNFLETRKTELERINYDFSVDKEKDKKGFMQKSSNLEQKLIELERLNDDLRARNADLNERLQKFESERINILENMKQMNLDNAKLNEEILILKEENSILASKLDKLVGDHENCYEDLNKKNAELAKKLDELLKEHQKCYDDMIKEKKKLEENFAESENKYKNKIINMENDYRTKIENYTQKISLLEQRISSIITEKEKVEKNLRIKIDEEEGLIRKLRLLEEQIHQLEEEKTRLESAIRDNIREYEKNLRILEEKNASLIKELERFENILREKAREHDINLQNMHREFDLKLQDGEAYYTNQVSSLKSTVKDLEHQNSLLRSDNEMLFNEKDHLLREIDLIRSSSPPSYPEPLRENIFRPPPPPPIFDSDSMKENIFRGPPVIPIYDSETIKENIFRSSPPIFEIDPMKENLLRPPISNNYPSFNNFPSVVPHFKRPPRNVLGSIGNMGERGLDILKDNERLNEQILRRCRQIIGEN